MTGMYMCSTRVGIKNIAFHLLVVETTMLKQSTFPTDENKKDGMSLG